MDMSAAKPINIDGDGSIELVEVINPGCPPYRGGQRALTSVHLRASIATIRSRRFHSQRRSRLGHEQADADPAGLPLLDNSDGLYTKIEFADLNGDAIPELMAAWLGNWTVGGMLGGGISQVYEADPNGQPAGIPQVSYGTRRGTVLTNYPVQFRRRYRRPTDVVTDEDGDGRFELMQLANDGSDALIRVERGRWATA